MKELKAQLESQLRHEYQTLESRADTHELTSEDIAALRELVSIEMQKLGLSPVDFGRLTANIIFIVGLEKILDGIERANHGQ